MVYNENDFLQLSGIQHFAFCRRQWALIHVEGLWADNLRTVEGNLLHERAHDESLREVRGDRIIVRGVRLLSATLGISGQCDVLEFLRSDQGISVKGQSGQWQPYPVEYKRGEPKDLDADRFQLCGQAMCLEEMLCCDIPEGALYYGQTRRREIVRFSQKMRGQVRLFIQEMHEYARRGYAPRVKLTKACNACSLKDFCLPKMMKQRSAAAYLASALQEDL